jgi:large subunit ribosomal protein L14
MIQTETLIRVADNSGAVLVKCVKVPGSSSPRVARTGDVILVSTRIVKFKPHIHEKKRIVKGALYKALVIRTKKPVFFKDGGFVRFSANNVVLFKKDQPRTFGGPKLAGSRIFGPLLFNKKLKKKYPKVFSLASGVIY